MDYGQKLKNEIIKNFIQLAVILIYVQSIQTSCKRSEEIILQPETKDSTYLATDQTELRFAKIENAGYRMNLTTKTTQYVTLNPDMPVTIEVYTKELSTKQVCNALYSEVTSNNGVVTCEADVTTTGGTHFLVEDKYTKRDDEGSIEMSRKINIVNPKLVDYAFNSFFGLHDVRSKQMSDYNFFMPSLIYKNSENLPQNSIGNSFSDNYILAREERMALPFVMMQDVKNGNMLTLINLNSNPQTFKGDFGTGHMVDKNMKFASIGLFQEAGCVSAMICYPGSEGERTYADGSSSSYKRWAKRSHPVETDIDHSYTIVIKTDNAANFPESVEKSWKYAFDLYNSKILALNSNDIYNYCIELLDNYWMIVDGDPGFPFSVNLWDGTIKEISYSMGFVGMQISCAYYLYRQGLETGNNSYVDKGNQVIDFWVKNSLTVDGFPRTWYDPAPYKRFRTPSYTREIQGGMEAVILAWATAKKHGIDKPEWLEYCKKAGDWMVRFQNTDGSYYLSYNHDNTPANTSKFCTSNLIRYLGYLFKATGDSRYKEAALKAGEFCYNNIHLEYKYIGSVIDNPGIKDKESGQKAVEAFLALYDLTGEKKWLDACVQAAIYTETYVYSWNIPMEIGDDPPEWPAADKETTGLSIIATGHSGADCDFSYSSFEYFRLYLITGDSHFLHVSKMSQKNTKQTMNYDGNLNYKYRGLQTEAIRVVTPRGYGVKLWLPWITASAVDPLLKFKDAFNEMDIDQIVTLPPETLKSMNDEFARTQGITN
jgi:hypothetical protein